jgi:transposase-like protein
MLKAIHASEDIAAAREKAIRVIEKLRGLRLTRAAEPVEAAVEETLSYYAFPEEHWRRIRTNNPLERILREIRRRTRVVGAFPDGQSALNLAAARLRHIAGTAWSTKRYLNIGLLKDQQMRGALSFGAACAIQIWRLPSYLRISVAHPRGESGSDAVRLDFDRRSMLQFRGA